MANHYNLRNMRIALIE